MAVENKYMDANIAAGKKTNSAYNDGAAVLAVVGSFEIVAADDNASVWRIIKGINSDLIPIEFKFLADAAATPTDVNFGIYESLNDGVGGTVIDDNALADAIDFSSGFARGSEQDGLSAVAIDAVKSPLWELAGQTLITKKDSYDLALTVIAKGAGAVATISWYGIFVQG